MLEVDAELVARREGILLISDKGFASQAFERELADLGVELLRPAFKREKKRFGEPMLKKVRQLIESVNDALKGQLDLEQHGGRDLRGRRDPGRPAHPGDGRRDLAQQPDRCTRHPLADRVRPLITSDLLVWPAGRYLRWLGWEYREGEGRHIDGQCVVG